MRSARVVSWRLGLVAAVMVAVSVPVYGAALSDPRAGVFAHLFPIAWVATLLWVARNLIRELRGWDRVTFGADALWLAQRGAWRTRRRRVLYDNIVDLQVESEPQLLMPRSMPERSFAPLRIEPSSYGVVLQRHGGRPVRLAQGFGHSLDAASWLTEQIRRGVRRARRAHGVAAGR